MEVTEWYVIMKLITASHKSAPICMILNGKSLNSLRGNASHYLPGCESYHCSYSPQRNVLQLQSDLSILQKPNGHITCSMVHILCVTHTNLFAAILPEKLFQNPTPSVQKMTANLFIFYIEHILDIQSTISFI